MRRRCVQGDLNEALAALAKGEPAPRLPVRLDAPDLRPFVDGNAGRGIWSFAAEAPGPHLCVVSLTHGNEIAGAIVLERWLRAGVRPLAGRLTLVFANLDAYARFSPDDPTASRFLEHDLNRVWDAELLDGPGRGCELRRARVLRPVFDSADVVLDLHSVLWPSDPLLLVAGDARSERLALSLREPGLVVSDPGHEAGRRLLDYLATRGQRALLLEGGDHWETATVGLLDRAARRLLMLLGLADSAPLLPAGVSRLARVSRTVTARGTGFRFVRSVRGGEVVPEAGTVLARDGGVEIRTPHDDCLLVMPNLRAAPGMTAVRFGRFVTEA
jgi:succinylglutamate desuccinylase